ncbi:MAG TPA: hypothetical protein VF020_20920 [Chthoniobacterales bacterium]
MTLLPGNSSKSTNYRAVTKRDWKGSSTDPAVFKIDYALDGNVPWIHEECHNAGTIHVGGTFEEVALAESK